MTLIWSSPEPPYMKLLHGLQDITLTQNTQPQWLGEWTPKSCLFNASHFHYSEPMRQ